MPVDTRTYEQRQEDRHLAIAEGWPGANSNLVVTSAFESGTITLAAPGSAARRYVSAIHASYSGTPSVTAGLVNLWMGTALTNIFSIAITSPGAHSFNFDPPLTIDGDHQLVATIGAADNAVARLNIHAGTALV